MAGPSFFVPVELDGTHNHAGISRTVEKVQPGVLHLPDYTRRCGTEEVQWLTHP